MGLFSGIIRAVSPIGNLILGSSASKKAINQARDATLAGITNAKGDLNSQLAASQGRLDPYEGAGTDALSGIRGLLGLNGGDQQGSAIDALKASPLYQSLFHNGQDTVLNNLSATGGLRGGNATHDLYNLGTDTLAQTIQQQLANLSPLMSQGLGATEFGAGLGQANAGALAGLDTGAGQANAGAILNKNAVTNNMFSGIQKLITSAISGGMGGGAGGGFDVSSLLGNVLGGGSSGAFPASWFSNPQEPWGQGSGYGANGGALPNFPRISSALPPISGGSLPF